jgi:hypothetical protein
LEDTFNSSQVHRIEKGNTGRLPNKACRYCCRKKVYPEKWYGKWRYPNSQECFDCIMVFDGRFDQIRRNKPTKKNHQHPLSFPLTIFDITKNVIVGEYNDKEKTQYAIDRYQSKQKKMKVDVLVTHYPNYYDFTGCFTNTHTYF